MLLNEFIILHEAAFSAKNFPEEGNQTFPGAGERTDYVNSPQNDEDGFPLMKSVKAIKKDRSKVDIESGTNVFITKPGKLVRGEDIGALPKSTIFALISRVSSKKKDALGYVPISSIQKPSKGGQSRVQTGSSAQDIIADKVSEMVDQDVETEVISTAKPGSTKPDLVMKVGNQEIQFEIKGTSSDAAPITFFDKTMRRGRSDDLLDMFAEVLTDGEVETFEQAVDLYREEDPTIGYPGDEGVGKSGKLPLDFRIKDPTKLKKFRSELIDHFKEGGDNYFAVHNRTKDTAKIYHIYGPNLLDADKFPQIKQFDVRTYGGPSGGGMRVGIKVKLSS